MLDIDNMQILEQDNIICELDKLNNLSSSDHSHDSLLDAGIHSLDMESLYKIAVENFENSKRRKLLFRSLCNFLSSLPCAAIVKELWIDGSFLTLKDEPNDIDILLILDETIINGLPPHQEASLKIYLDHYLVAYRYKLDCYTVLSNNLNQISYWRGWYGFCRDGKTAKGIASIEVKI